MTDQHQDHSGSGRALWGATAANSVLLVVQVVGAVTFGSVALLADSVHQASDVVSLLLAVVIASLVARPASSRYTFGFRRADALGGLVHAALLIAGAAFVGLESVDRFSGDHQIDGLGVIIVAIGGLIVNGATARWLHGAHGHSLNVEGAVLHLVADALGSLAVLIGGIAFVITDEPLVDALASLVVVVLIIGSAIQLTRSSLHVLLDGVPRGVDVDELRLLLLDDPMVTEAHHLHVRTLDGSTLSLTAHVQVDTEDLHQAQVVTDRLGVALAVAGIGHVTLQAECHPCDDADC